MKTFVGIMVVGIASAISLEEFKDHAQGQCVSSSGSAGEALCERSGIKDVATCMGQDHKCGWSDNKVERAYMDKFHGKPPRYHVEERKAPACVKEFMRRAEPEIKKAKKAHEECKAKSHNQKEDEACKRHVIDEMCREGHKAAEKHCKPAHAIVAKLCREARGGGHRRRGGAPACVKEFMRRAGPEIAKAKKRHDECKTEACKRHIIDELCKEGHDAAERHCKPAHAIVSRMCNEARKDHGGHNGGPPACVRELMKKGEPKMREAKKEFDKCKSKRCKHTVMSETCKGAHEMARQFKCPAAHHMISTMCKMAHRAIEAGHM